MKIGKILKRTFIGLVVIFLVIWLAALLKCEILTAMHGSEFDEIYRENTMMGDIDYLKILEYSDKYARVYYVSANKGAADILTFAKEADKWKYDRWEATVWSDSGSASEVIWLYWWHFIYGGI